MRSLKLMMKVFTLLVCLMVAGLFTGCNNGPAPVNSAQVSAVAAQMHAASEVNTTDARRLSDGASKLIEAMKRPTLPFHFTYKGLENLNVDKALPPQVGPVGMQADISPEEIDLIETRGPNTKATKAKYGDDVNWGMANLSTLGVMTSPTLVIAVGASVTDPPTTDLVGGTVADKFAFDTSTAASPAQKMALERARMVVTTIKDCKGTAWIAENSGLLVKFNIDANYVDGNNHAWKEHYEGVVSPK
jgi:hypothetical protein